MFLARGHQEEHKDLPKENTEFKESLGCKLSALGPSNASFVGRWVFSSRHH